MTKAEEGVSWKFGAIEDKGVKNFKNDYMLHTD